LLLPRSDKIHSCFQTIPLLFHPDGPIERAFPYEERMGTWSAEVFGNDTSCEIKEYFYEQYNRGSEVTQIVSMYTQRLLSTVGIGVQYNLAYPQFAISMKKALQHWKQNEGLYSEKVSKETITRLNSLLVLNK